MKVNGKLKREELSDEDVPLARRDSNINKKVKREEISDEDMPLARRDTIKEDRSLTNANKPDRKRLSKVSTQSEPEKKKVKKEVSVKEEKKTPKKAAKEEEPVWEWWKEKKTDNKVKWNFLEHNGPCFAPEYEPLPSHVKFMYAGKPMKLSPRAEEAATFYAKMFDHEYTTKEVFNANFMKDWRKLMTKEEREAIKDFAKCDFKQLKEYFTKVNEERKALSKEEKEKIKLQNEALVKKYGYCKMDAYVQKIGNFRIEPPGLFRGRGDHPKMGCIKLRIHPCDVIINCSKGSIVPQPPPGTKWKDVTHDNKVTWLASWKENVQDNIKYIMLNASSRLKGEKDWTKYETARRLHAKIDSIRAGYIQDFKSKEMRVRQRAVALYFIDELALRAGNEKGDEEADTVGCCSLRVEHITLTNEDGKREVEFNFLGKDSIPYKRTVEIPKKVYNNLELFKQGKQEGDQLFDRLNTGVLNQYLQELMPGLTAKVFRTYNASRTLETELLKEPAVAKTLDDKIYHYNRANRSVAVLCNHQRAAPKTFDKSMEALKEKMDKRQKEISDLKSEGNKLKAEFEKSKEAAVKNKFDLVKKKLVKAKEMLQKMSVQQKDRTENKEIALGTSKLNYLDPRISLAWCKRAGVPINKVYNKTQLQKFQWAVDMSRADFRFCDLESDRNTNQLQEAGDEEDEDDD